MTIAIGLETKDCVLLAVDSAVTHGRPVVWSTSSMGETSDLSHGIEEGALKIVSLGTHAAAAIAGTAHDAVEALAWFAPHVQAVGFVEAWTAAMSGRQQLDFVALVGRWHNGAPELYRCDGGIAQRVRPGRAAIIGSARDEERETLETRTRLLLVHGNRPPMIQLGLCALLAWRALNEVGFKDNIGGAPASLLVDEKGTAWMPDTSIYVVDVRPNAEGRPALQDMVHRVSIIGRENVVAVASTYTRQTRLLANPLTSEQLPEWIAEWGDEVLRIANENSVKLVALVGLLQRRLAVLELELCQGKYIRVEPGQVTFGDELRGFFLGPPPALPGGAVYSIPLGEPAAVAMAHGAGPVDEYDIDLGVSFMISACAVQQNFQDADRVWESMRGRFPRHKGVLTAGLVAFELEPGAPRLDKVLGAWESALEIDPHLIEHARFVATRHPEHPEIGVRLLAAVARAESLRSS